MVLVKKNYIGIREARINLSRLIRDVRGGMEIVITDRGTPVARLTPVDSASLSLEERIRNYESCGLIESRPKPTKPNAIPIELPDGYIKHYFREEADDE